MAVCLDRKAKETQCKAPIGMTAFARLDMKFVKLVDVRCASHSRGSKADKHMNVHICCRVGSMYMP